ncbi:MAG: alpha/beta hydrolase [Pseudomonadota bacterium]
MDFALKQMDIGAGRRIGYRDAGSGPALLLLHGVGSNSQSFDEQLRGLADAFRVIAWDAPGYGGSDDPLSDTPSAADYGDDAIALLDALGIQSAGVVGHSMGGLIATALVARHAQRVAAVVLSSCASGYARLADDERAARLAGRIDLLREGGPEGLAASRGPGNCAPGTGPEVIRRVVDIMARVRPAGYLAGARLLDAEDVFAHLSCWPRPPPRTLVLVGSHDRTTPPPGSRRIAHALMTARYQELPNSAHAGFLEEPDAFNDALRQHFEGAQP